MTANFNDTAVNAVRKYHQQTKHHFQAYAPSPGFLDWDSQPNPFRTYEGSDKVDLPILDDRSEAIDIGYAELFKTAQSARPFNMESLGQLLELAAGLSAWKSDGHNQWSLRNNPSSGNLHPTEFYLLIWQQQEETAPLPGLYHYNAFRHQLELRAKLAENAQQEILQAMPNSYGAIGLSSILWREEWKYDARALRYCQHDVGHAIASLNFAARTLGWQTALLKEMGDELLTNCLGLNRHADFENAELEHPDCLAILSTDIPPDLNSLSIWHLIAESLNEWKGKANRLSRENIRWPEIKNVIPYLEKPESKRSIPTGECRNTNTEYFTNYDQSALKVIRKRRSAQRMSGTCVMKESHFYQILQRTLPITQTPPFNTLSIEPAIHFLVYVHQVENMDSGIYTFSRSHKSIASFMDDCKVKNYEWQHSSQNDFPLYRLEAPLNASKLASQLHCYQGIAGKGAFAIDMIADMQLLQNLGAWSYRYLFWEAGFIGQILYLEAEALGYNGTGIGCYFDDEIHRLMGLDSNGRWQCVYGFTIGEALLDQRLANYSGYMHLDRKENHGKSSTAL